MSQDPGRNPTDAGFHGAGSEPGSDGEQRAETFDSLKEGARSLGDEARERAERYVQGGKDTVTGGLDAFAQAIRKASDELNANDQTMAAQLVRQAAGGLESLSRSIGGASIHDLVDSARSFARANPAALVGVSVLAGLALGRFARASARERERSDWNAGRGPGGGDSWSEEDASGFNAGLQPYSGASYPVGERAAFAPATHGGADAPPSSQGYAGGGMENSLSGTPGPSSETEPSVGSESHSGGAAQPGSISTGAV